MAHEVVILRKNKGSALTYEELDSNFENYIEFREKFATTEADGSTSFPNFIGSNDGKFLYWDNSTGTVGVKNLSDSDLTSGFATNFNLSWNTKTTDHLTEGVLKFYYTDARWDTRFANVDTDSLTEGSTNQYYTSARANADFDTRLATKSTTNLSEGTNLYFTDARADARIAVASLTTLSNVDLVSASEDGKILSYNHATTSFKWKEDTTATNLTNLTDVDAVTGSDDGEVLYYDHALSSFKWKPLVGNTDGLTEGSTNLYYTDIRANAAIDARVTNAYITSLNLPPNEQSFLIKQADFNPDVGYRYGIDTSSQVVTATLPAGAVTGDSMFFVDVGRNFSTNNFTIDRNGMSINGVASSIVLTTTGESIGLVKTGSGWFTYIGYNTSVYGG